MSGRSSVGTPRSGSRSRPRRASRRPDGAATAAGRTARAPETGCAGRSRSAASRLPVAGAAGTQSELVVVDPEERVRSRRPRARAPRSSRSRPCTGATSGGRSRRGRRARGTAARASGSRSRGSSPPPRPCGARRARAGRRGRRACAGRPASLRPIRPRFRGACSNVGRSAATSPPSAVRQPLARLYDRQPVGDRHDRRQATARPAARPPAPTDLPRAHRDPAGAPGRDGG